MRALPSGARVARILAVLSAVVAAGTVAAPAAAAPPSDTAGTVQGAGTTPGAVVVGWTPPADPSYAGTRVVVVVGRTPTADPNDPAAVSTTDVASGAASAAVSGLAGGQDYSASAFAYDATRSYAPPASTSWTEPGAPTTVSATGDDAGLGGVIHLSFDVPATADRAVVCVADTSPPAAPAAPARCGTNNAGDVAVAAGRTYGVAVFGWSSTLQGYGPPATTTVVVPDNPPIGTGDDLMTDVALDAHTVDISWVLPIDTGTARDLTDWVVTRAVGTTPAPPEATPLTVFPTPTRAGWDPITYRARGLVTNQPYTFTVRARDAGGNLSAPASITVAARVPGTYIVDNDNRRRRWHTTALPCPGPPETTAGAAAGETPAGAVAALFVCWSAPDPLLEIASRAPGRSWSPRVAVGRLYAGGHALLRASPGGRVTVAWTSPAGPVLRVRVPGHGWQPGHRLPAITAGAPGWTTDVVGLAVDRAGRPHLLLTVATDGGLRLFYATELGGRWRISLVRHATVGLQWTHAAITLDRATDSIVVATSEAAAGGTRALVRLTRVASARATLPRPVVVDAASGEVVSDVAAAGGRIAVVLQRSAPSAAPGVFLTTGTAPASMARPARIARTGLTDREPRVAMSSARAISVAWFHGNPAWPANGEGVVVATRVFHPNRHTWTWGPAVRRTRSHYDVPVDLIRDAKGHLVVVVNRAADG